MSTSNPNVGHINVTITKNSLGQVLVNLQFDYYTDFNVAFSTFIINVPSYENDKDFQKELLRSTINLCKIKQGVMGNFFIKLFLENFEKSSDYKMECPFKKGKSSIKNMEITDIPNYLFQSFKFIATVTTKVKTPNNKNLVHLYTIKAYGERIMN